MEPPKGERQNVHLLFNVAGDSTGDQGPKTNTTLMAAVRTPNLCEKWPLTSIAFC